MSKTTIVLFVICTAVFVGVAIYTGLTVEKVLYAISHPDTILPSITSVLGTVWATIQNHLALFGVGIGSLVIGVGSALKWAAGKIRAWRQTAETIEESALEKKVAWETQVKDLEATIAAKEQEFATKFNEQATLITSSQQQANTALSLRTELERERDDAIRELEGLRKEVETFKKLYQKA